MGVLPIVLVILAMKIPIFGLLWLVWWAGRPKAAEDGPGERVRHGFRPRRPGPAGGLGPRRRGPHGGAAVRPVVRRRGGVSVAPATRDKSPSRIARLP